MEIFVFMALKEFQDFLKSIVPHSLLPSHITTKDYVPLDLSVENKELKSVNISSVQDLQNYVGHIITKNSGKVAYGGYLEKRGIYKRSDYFNQKDPNTERNIHLGIDLWIDSGTLIYAPLPGTLHSFNNNTNFGDYGPCIILKHQIKDFEFFTLYGHLSLESLDNKEIGKRIKKGEPFATLGTAEVNGTYPPHLHFQIIKDIQDYKGDYPGVTNELDLEFYKKNCPDPNLLLKIN